MKDFKVLNNNALKLIALVAMTFDHVGMMLFPDVLWFRIIGRLAFPIFAYMIAEGCFYTGNRLKYILLVLGVGLFCQAVYIIADFSFYLNTLLTFTLSILTIYTIDKAFKNKSLWWALLIAILLAEVFICRVLPGLLAPSGIFFDIDYSLAGILMPVLIYIPNYFTNVNEEEKRLYKLILTALGCVATTLGNSWSVQWYSLLAIIPLALYNGRRGKLKLKYLFYIYYPVHFGVITLISMLIK